MRHYPAGLAARLPPVPHRDGLVEDNEPLVYVPAAPFPEALEELEVLGPKRDVLLPDGREQPQRLPVVDERREKLDQKAELSAKLEVSQQADSSTENWFSMMQDYSKLKTLDRPTLLRLIDRIEIGERRVVDGRDERDIRIFYKFVGLIEV